MHAPGAVQESAPWQSSYPYGSTTSTTASQAVAAVPAAGAHNHSGTAATGDSAGKNDTGDDAYDPTADVDPVEPSIAPWQPPTPASLADHNHLQETQEQQHCAAGYVDSKGQPTHSAHLTPHAGTALGFTATEAAPNAKRQRTEGPRQEHAAHCHANRSMTPGASASMQEKSPPERLQPVHVVLVWDLDEVRSSSAVPLRNFSFRI